MKEISIKSVDPKHYGVNWHSNDEDPTKQLKSREREKPFCEIEDCNNRVSTEFGKPKPFCKDHVFENPYVKNLIKKMESLDVASDRKTANEAFKRATAEHEAAKAERRKQNNS